MTLPDIAQALMQARHEELIRAAATQRMRAVARQRHQRRRLVAWLDGQRLGHRRAPALGTAACGATR